MSRCPVCKQPTAAEWRPFCTKRCADIDLGRWFTGAYVVLGEPAGTDGPSDDGREDEEGDDEARGGPPRA